MLDRALVQVRRALGRAEGRRRGAGDHGAGAARRGRDAALHGGQGPPRRARLRRPDRQDARPARARRRRPSGCSTSSTTASITSSSTRARTRARRSGRWWRRWPPSSSPATGAREEVRTVFAVGDEKQSIYSFQGAAPEMFASMGERFADMAEGRGRSRGGRIPLERVVPHRRAGAARRRSRVRGRDRTPGVEAQASHPPYRQALRPCRPRRDLADRDVRRRSPRPTPGRRSRTRPSALPVVRLANRIADTIKRLTSGETLASEGRPIAPGDILILVRKRQPFAAPMVAALKARGMPVAGADRMRLTEQIAVQDLISLGDFLTLPEDDLALAEVLKSPLFDLRRRRSAAPRARAQGHAVEGAARQCRRNAALRRDRRDDAEALAQGGRLHAALRVLRRASSIATACARSSSRASAPMPPTRSTSS